MTKISETQLELLGRLEGRRRHLGADHIVKLLEFLREKPADEPIDPRWVDTWERLRRSVEGIPSSIIEEISDALKNIPLTDKEVADIRIVERNRVTFLLGAGMSSPSNIPTVDKLLFELWKRAKKIGREDLDRLNAWCDERGINNIEDLLTAAYISDIVARSRSATSLIEYFLFAGGRESIPEDFQHRPRATRLTDTASISFLQETLQTLFGLLASTMLPAKPNDAHKALVDFVKKHKNTSVITTNYDGLIDEALLTSKMTLGGTLGAQPAGFGGKNNVELIKMHGSINWTYCDSCQDVREFNMLQLKKDYLADTHSYPVIGICRACGGQRRPLLVPPLSIKFLQFPPLIDLWNTARTIIESTDYLFVVGYRFSEADTYIAKIISRAMALRPSLKMIVVNTNRDLVPQLRDRFSTRIDGFDVRRILRVSEGCEASLPKLLKSMLGA